VDLLWVEFAGIDPVKSELKVFSKYQARLRGAILTWALCSAFPQKVGPDNRNIYQPTQLVTASTKRSTGVSKSQAVWQCRAVEKGADPRKTALKEGKPPDDGSVEKPDLFGVQIERSGWGGDQQ
jgi:hypothetical protein